MDPQDVLQQTLLQAIQEDHFVDNIFQYVGGMCRFTMLNNLRRKQAIPFADIGTALEEDRRDDYLEALTATRDPEYNEFDHELITAIEQAIDTMPSTKANRWVYSPKKRQDLKALLHALAESAQQNMGVGVDEYDQMQPLRNRWRSDRYHGQQLKATLPARSLLLDSIAEKFGIARNTARNNMILLRKCAEPVTGYSPD